jgi:proteasome lid subunit RPN8/RPN11
MSKSAKAIAQSHRIVMEAEVGRQVRQHSRSSPKTEVCGVLIGKEEGSTTVVEACIAGANAAQGGAHVTFTQDTWEHIYQIKDKKYPEDRIVGWYHSHPGFGVFLSDHDLFIHENFFSSPQQIAWVYDPHNDEEGCFGWHEGKIEKINDVAFRFGQECGESVNAGEEQTAPLVKVKGGWKDELLSMSRDVVMGIVFSLIGAAGMYYYIGKKAFVLPKGGQALVILDGEELAVVRPDVARAVLDILKQQMDATEGSTPGASKTPQANGGNGNQQGGQDGRAK